MLKKALVDIGRIDSAGGIAAKVVVPIPPVVSATANVGNLVWAKDPEALLKENEAAFAAAGATGDAIKKLYVSNGFTLTLHTRFAQALGARQGPRASATTSRRRPRRTRSARRCSSSRARSCCSASMRRHRRSWCSPTRGP